MEIIHVFCLEQIFITNYSSSHLPSCRSINKQLMIYEMKMFFSLNSPTCIKLFHQRYQHTNGQLNAPVFISLINVVDCFVFKEKAKSFCRCRAISSFVTQILFLPLRLSSFCCETFFLCLDVVTKICLSKSLVLLLFIVLSETFCALLR